MCSYQKLFMALLISYIFYKFFFSEKKKNFLRKNFAS